jgi:4-hydroxythreonine-4-phosphate dehydrogenase
VAVADPDLLAGRAREIGMVVQLSRYRADVTPRPTRAGALLVRPVRLHAPARPGILDPANAPYVVASVRLAAEGCLAGELDALVTGPLHKGVLNEGGIAFTGHTELLAEIAGSRQVVMLLATTGLRVALATTHLPLARVSEAITQERVEGVGRVLVDGLRHRFGIPSPRVLVCGLNPHAGEGGHLGREEITVIAPVIERLRREGLDLVGPVPADTAFLPSRLAGVDAVLAMYHDQGLPVIKREGFGRAVNVTLGLPFVRTSVDHGTALELAGTGRADPGSLVVAIESALHQVARRP